MFATDGISPSFLDALGKSAPVERLADAIPRRTAGATTMRSCSLPATGGRRLPVDA